ncbi:glycine betaine ABC transporter substrate-binding protein [Salinicola halophyticus]|uniref:glycine betaine ABC transporter substrate-binding protein n=1 Tax=Salinicola halophyticus TaxID=1808881 RepID=UPI000DA143B4|nr:glycine betaine ABC transporter substrate-binding protein [Salinicola halophyticus]
MRKAFYPFAAVLFTMASIASIQADAQDQAQEKPLVIGTNNWAENVAVANLWKLVLDDHGYDVKLADVSKSALYAGMDSNDIDLSLEIWLPYTDKSFLEPYKNTLEVHEAWYDKTGLGLVVPSYVDIDTIPELVEHADEFEYQGSPTILGIDSGSAIAGMTEDAIETYDLPLQQVNSSEPAMMSALDSAYRNHEPMVVTLWNPHWAFANYDLKYLEDPDKVYGDGDTIYWFSRQGFSKDDPWLTAVLDAWHMSDASLSDLMAEIESQDDPVAGARTWLDENQDQVDEWLAAGEQIQD